MGRTSLLLGLILLMGLVFIRVWDPYPVQAGRNLYFDGLQQIKPRPYQDVGVRVVDIDEASLRELGQWPWPRDIVADLVAQLQAYGAAIVVFDVLFAEADRYSEVVLLFRTGLRLG
jgi:adenylate cyclase